MDRLLLPEHLRGETGTTDRTVFWRSTRWGVQHAVRQANWKYLRIDKPQARSKRTESGELLFDLSRDPQEQENLAAAHPDVAERLRRSYGEWEAGVLPPIEPVASPSNIR